MRALLLAALVLILPAVSAAAQTPPVSVVRIVVSGGVAPITNDLPIANVQCGQPKATQPPVQPGVTHNPNIASWDDPSAPTTLYCKYTDTGVAPSPLLALPFGGTVYTATIAFVYGSAGPGPLSVVSNPFDHPGVPGTTAPTGLRVTQ